MSLASLITADATGVFLDTNDFAESVTQRPLGNSANDAAVSAVVMFPAAEEDDDGGEGQADNPTLDVADTVGCDVRDQWQIGGVWYQAQRVDVAEGGLRRVHARRTAPERRTGPKTVL